MVTHSTILAWEIPRREEPERLHVVPGVAEELDLTEQLNHNDIVDLQCCFSFSVQQSDSVTHTHILFQIVFSYRLFQSRAPCAIP